ncbi:hypothetical protein D3C86_1658330 [compost metagenome]
MLDERHQLKLRHPLTNVGDDRLQRGVCDARCRPNRRDFVRRFNHALLSHEQRAVLPDRAGQRSLQLQVKLDG